MKALAYREAIAEDVPFVLDHWIDSYKRSHAAGPIPMCMYQDIYRRIVPWILQRTGVELWVAHHPGLTPDTKSDLHGFACVEYGGARPLLHYVYTKKNRRRNGIAGGLLKAAGFNIDDDFAYTFKTGLSSGLRHKAPGGKFSPLSVRYTREAPSHVRKNTHPRSAAQV